MSTSIEICSQVLSYQKRYFWMLSSILAQKNVTPHKLVVKANFHNQDHFDKLSDNLLNIFCEPLNFKPKFYDNQEFGLRGYTRFHDIKEAECEWMLFTDADIVFPENFFSNLFQFIETTNEKNVVFTVSKKTMDPIHAYNFVNTANYDTPIINPYDKIKHITRRSSRRIPGAGYFQLFRTQEAKNKRLDKMGSWFKREGNLLNDRRKFSGDIQFRKIMGNVKIIPTPDEIIHLNHYRAGDKEFNKEICQ